LKDEHWASCNETCFQFTKWEGTHGHGHWRHTHHLVWDCADITAERVDDEERRLHWVSPPNPMPGFHHWFDHRHGSSDYKDFVYDGCTEDGHDCRYSRCCAREGSRCYLKDEHWASCNETCFQFTKWEGTHGHGHWRHTHHLVWDCTDITAEGPVDDEGLDRRLHWVSPPNPMPGFHHHAYWPAPEEYEAYTYGTCQEDGHNCLYSRCCAREGSRCYVKNEHWATCNATCLPFTKWEGSHHHGHWRHTHHREWDCSDITADGPEDDALKRRLHARDSLV